MVAVPYPPDRVELPEVCLVTGQRRGVALRPAPLYTWRRDAVELPLTQEGQEDIERRARSARALQVLAVLVSVAFMVLLGAVLPAVGAGRYLALVLFVVGVLVARHWRHRTLHAFSRRQDVLVLDVPNEEAAASLREAVRAAGLPDDHRRRLASAEQLARLNERRHPLAP